jgi:hypothetical protein
MIDIAERRLSLFSSIAACVLTLSAFVPARSQTFSRDLSGIPVVVHGDTIRQPFTGGINAPFHQFVDIDGDGDLDLFVFDGDQILDFYQNDGSRTSPMFRLRPHTIDVPPFLFWFRFLDLNGDGLLDLLTDDSSSGISYYRNVGTIHQPQFQLVSSPLLDSNGVPVFAGFGSLPSFVDIDGDGLLDMLSSNSLDGSINYYRNVGTPAQPLLRFVTSKFQDITIIGEDCSTGASLVRSGKSNAHGNAAVETADIDGDGAIDLFVGDQFANGLFLFANHGTPRDPCFVCVTNRYPPGGNPIVTSGFNQPSFVDIDGDGDRDLFAGVLNNQWRGGFLFYENTGSRSQPQFQRRTDDYLHVLDVGGYSHPALADVNGDSLIDLIVGNVFGQLWYFRNTGTRTVPAFVLADTAFGSITGSFSYAPAFADLDGDGTPELIVGRFDCRVIRYRRTGGSYTPVDTVRPSVSLNNAVPTFADIDGDGDLDLFVGKSNGTISFYRNDGSSLNFAPTLVTQQYAEINVGDNAKPTFTFNDESELYDLYVGNSEGRIFQYENVGTPGNAQFVLRTDRYAAIDPVRESALAFADIDGNGTRDLFVGNWRGGLHFYRNTGTMAGETIAPRPSTQFSFAENVKPDAARQHEILTSPESMSPRDRSVTLSRLLRPSTATQPIGSNEVLTDCPSLPPPLPTAFELRQNYPNPFNGGTEIVFDLPVASVVTLKIFDLLGREVATLVDGMQPAGTRSATWTAGGAASGVYLLRFEAASVEGPPQRFSRMMKMTLVR